MIKQDKKIGTESEGHIYASLLWIPLLIFTGLKAYTLRYNNIYPTVCDKNLLCEKYVMDHSFLFLDIYLKFYDD